MVEADFDKKDTMPRGIRMGPKENQENVRKHGVAFSEAATVFNDELSRTFQDPFHSKEEDRYITVGASWRNRLLMVAHTDRGERIRIISARGLTAAERRDYEEDRSKRDG